MAGRLQEEKEVLSAWSGDSVNTGTSGTAGGPAEVDQPQPVSQVLFAPVHRVMTQILEYILAVALCPLLTS